jgi:hypothetical protein
MLIEIGSHLADFMQLLIENLTTYSRKVVASPACKCKL